MMIELLVAVLACQISAICWVITLDWLDRARNWGDPPATPQQRLELGRHRRRLGPLSTPLR